MINFIITGLTLYSQVLIWRYNVTLNNNDIGLFKTPTLRNIELTPPYMHDGRYLTLEEVVEHYNSGLKNIQLRLILS